MKLTKDTGKSDGPVSVNAGSQRASVVDHEGLERLKRGAEKLGLILHARPAQTKRRERKKKGGGG